jgi:type II secretory pathway pseudopilin PulG
VKRSRLQAIRSSSGFSLLELIVVGSIVLVLTAAAIPQIISTLREARVKQAYEDVLSSMRRAHEIAVDRRRVVVLTFNPVAGANPANVTMLQEQIVAGPPVTYVPAALAGQANPEVIKFPTDMDIILPATVPGTGPEGLGTPAASATDYGYSAVNATAGLKTLYFQADGTVLRDNEVGAVASGAIYIGRAGDKNSNRAVSVLGQTGRVKGWRLVGGAWVPY